MLGGAICIVSRVVGYPNASADGGSRSNGRLTFRMMLIILSLHHRLCCFCQLHGIGIGIGGMLLHVVESTLFVLLLLLLLSMLGQG